MSLYFLFEKNEKELWIIGRLFDRKLQEPTGFAAQLLY